MENEKRLIDANELLEKVQFRSPIDNKNAEVIAGCVDITRRLIENAPTVDAVEVVRCKDCKSSRKLNNNESLYLVDECLICTNCKATDHGWNPVFPTHFCSYGERRTDNG